MNILALKTTFAAVGNQQSFTNLQSAFIIRIYKHAFLIIVATGKFTLPQTRSIACAFLAAVVVGLRKTSKVKIAQWDSNTQEIG